MDYSMPAKPKNIEPSTIENIDTGLFNWVKEFIDIAVTTNDGYKKVPVIWLGSERAFQVKSNQLIRDSAGKLIMPLSANGFWSKPPSNKDGGFLHFSLFCPPSWLWPMYGG